MRKIVSHLLGEARMLEARKSMPHWQIIVCMLVLNQSTIDLVSCLVIWRNSRKSAAVCSFVGAIWFAAYSFGFDLAFFSLLYLRCCCNVFVSLLLFIGSSRGILQLWKIPLVGPIVKSISSAWSLSMC